MPDVEANHERTEAYLPGRAKGKCGAVRRAPSRWLALSVICAGMLMVVLDITRINVALPSIETELGVSRDGLTWIVTAYLVSFGGLLLLAGRLGDLIGARTIFVVGLGVVALASLLCGLAQSTEVLVAGRAVQGVGAACTIAPILKMLVAAFPHPREQLRAIGINGAVASAGGSLGLLGAGALTDSLGWRWAFFAGVPACIAAGAAALFVIEHRGGLGLRAGADIPGAVLVAGALMLAVYTIAIPAPRDGWSAGVTLALGGVSIALLVAFVIREALARIPLMPLSLIRLRNVAAANLIQFLSVPAMYAIYIFGSMYAQYILLYGAFATGLAYLPGAIASAALSGLVAAPLAHRLGVRPTLILSLGLVAVALVLLARVPTNGRYIADVLPAVVLFGVGAGIALPVIERLAVSDVAPQDAGLASGLMGATAQLGGALGVAVLASLSTTRIDAILVQGGSTAAALTSGYRLGFSGGAVLICAAIVVAATMPSRSRVR
jgi:EmrB/QacA subfamily drug resistance transporter